MRALFASVSLILAVLYAAGAVYFYSQEYWARNPSELSAADFDSLQHPEATLGLVRIELQRSVPSADVEIGLERLMHQAPSFYQPPLLLALHHADRMDEPALVRHGFETAIARFPANGRLHAAYAEWLLSARSDLAAWAAISDTNVPQDPLPLAEDHIRVALELEPALTGELLNTMHRYGVPAGRWAELIPDDDLAQRELVAALFAGEHDAQALVLLRSLLTQPQDESFLRQATGWALQRGEPELALQAALAWQRIEEEDPKPDSYQWALYVARAHLALDDPDAAYQSFRDTLKRIESSSGTSSQIGLELLCAMAYEYLSRGETFLAESLFTEATTLSPTYTPAILGLARILLRAGDEAAAIEQYQRVLREEPNHPEAERELQQLLASPDSRRSSLR
jgi:Tfp pilus assembly protein PilF